MEKTGFFGMDMMTAALIAHRSVRAVQVGTAVESGLLRTLCLGAQDLYAAPDPLRASPQPMPRSMLWLALACCVVSLLGATWLSARLQLSPRNRWLWVVLCGVVGLPALLALWLMVPKRETLPASLPNLQPAIA